MSSRSPLLKYGLCWAMTLVSAFSLAVRAAVMEVSYRGPESAHDLRYEYNLAILRLALDNTRDEYGDYRLHAEPPMNTARSIQALRKNAAPNLILELSYEDRHAQSELDYVPFPVDLGVVGYRICFVAPKTLARGPMPTTLSDLRKLTIGQGIGWADSAILRHNGFNVIESGQYENLFRMVSANRFDLFCRGINEIFPEYAAHHDLPGLKMDQQILLYYPLPRFFFLHRDNQRLKARVMKGLQRGYASGQLQALWQHAYLEGVKAANAANRQLFILDNPVISTLHVPWQVYQFDVQHLRFAPVPPAP